MDFQFSCHKFFAFTSCKYLLILSLLTYFVIFSIINQYPNSLAPCFFYNKQQLDINDFFKSNDSPTNLSHLRFGLFSSEATWHERKSYIKSWWRPNLCRGFLYLDKAPTGVLPWSKASPPYRVSTDLTKFLEETHTRAPVVQIRMVHRIMEVFKEVEHENFRWLIMGDDDSIFFIENMVDVLAQYDHTKYYYIGGQSEFIMSNYWYSFNQGFGGAGVILSYPLAKALAQDMEGCLRRYAQLHSSDHIIMACIADIGVNLSPQKGLHQIDLRGDISGFLSSHQKSPLLSLHHFDDVEPIFPNMDRFQSTRHLMKAAKADQSRIMQQTICHHSKYNWTFSISWGYSAQIYKEILPRSFLQIPIETFKIWVGTPRERPQYMFDTRLSSDDFIETRSVFFFRKVKNTWTEILTIYSRASPQNSSDFISEIHVSTPLTKRKKMDRCECCDVVGIDGSRARIKFRECMVNEIIA